ncbi:hypothetical protein HDC94_001473 [Leifsonia sp. AK011]|uniref:hypothetical protein n=1 Tax=Leifsonia sp. AK011 TaxID=2723075 RepID=UPI0015C9FE69|nr:hypothetical protein [Leifsonia sp. AK011]NYF10317.1 hypothetical protein [Leifsonia sp. AK011]
MSLQRLVPVTVVVLLTASLAACTSDAPASTPIPTAVTSASATPSPTPTPSAIALTCESLLGPELWATAADTLAGRDYLDKIRNEGSPVALFEEYGGVVCAVAAGDEIGAFYAASPIDADAQAVQEERLLSESYVASSVDRGTLYTDVSGRQPPGLDYFFRDGNWWMASSPDSLTAIVANWPGA